jgi:hypothetical protein
MVVLLLTGDGMLNDESLRKDAMRYLLSGWFGATDLSASVYL